MAAAVKSPMINTNIMAQAYARPGLINGHKTLYEVRNRDPPLTHEASSRSLPTWPRADSAAMEPCGENVTREASTRVSSVPARWNVPPPKVTNMATPITSPEIAAGILVTAATNDFKAPLDWFVKVTTIVAVAMMTVAPIAASLRLVMRPDRARFIDGSSKKALKLVRVKTFGFISADQ